jgi:hypothetical protein
MNLQRHARLTARAAVAGGACVSAAGSAHRSGAGRGNQHTHGRQMGRALPPRGHLRP